MARKQNERKDMPAQNNPGKTEAPGRETRNTGIGQQEGDLSDEQKISNDTTRGNRSNENSGNRSSEEPVDEQSPRTGA